MTKEESRRRAAARRNAKIKALKATVLTSLMIALSLSAFLLMRS